MRRGRKEQNIFDRAKARDPRAWDEIYQAYRENVLNLCGRFAQNRSEAEDLTQEVFLKLFRSIDSFDEEISNFGAWSHAVARNFLVDHYRKHRNDPEPVEAPEGETDVFDRIAASTENPHQNLERRELAEVLKASLGQISPLLREAVVQRDIHGYDYPELARQMEIPEATLRSRVARGRLELKRVLTDRNYLN